MYNIEEDIHELYWNFYYEDLKKTMSDDEKSFEKFLKEWIEINGFEEEVYRGILFCMLGYTQHFSHFYKNLARSRIG